uniref:Midasin AAA ATPase 1 n=1 Tax=Dromaius novaehollandiae TaxID=8790 RepID=A0A8C4P5F2_DRONO
MAELRFRLAEPLQLVARRNEKSSAELSRFLVKQVWTQQDRQCILDTLAQLLLDKECTILIGRQFRPILLDLLERNAEAIKAGGQINHDLHERLCVAMSKLVADHPNVLPYTSNCLALVTCMNDEHKLSFLKKIFSPEELIHFRLKLLEESQLQNVERALLLANRDSSFWQKGKELQYTQGDIVSGDLSANVVAVCGIMLPRLQLLSEEQVCNPGLRLYLF